MRLCDMGEGERRVILHFRRRKETLAPWKRTAISKRRKKERGGGFYAVSNVGQHSLKCITVRNASREGGNAQSVGL